MYLDTLPSLLLQWKQRPEVSMHLFQAVLSNCVPMRSLLLKDFAFITIHSLFCNTFPPSTHWYIKCLNIIPLKKTKKKPWPGRHRITTSSPPICLLPFTGEIDYSLSPPILPLPPPHIPVSFELTACHWNSSDQGCPWPRPCQTQPPSLHPYLT